MFGLEFAKLNALMKLAVIDHDDRLAGPGARGVVTAASQAAPTFHALRLHDDLIVNAEFALRHSRQVRFHHDLKKERFSIGNTR